MNKQKLINRIDMTIKKTLVRGAGARREGTLGTVFQTYLDAIDMIDKSDFWEESK